MGSNLGTPAAAPPAVGGADRTLDAALTSETVWRFVITAPLRATGGEPAWLQRVGEEDWRLRDSSAAAAKLTPGDGAGKLGCEDSDDTVGGTAPICGRVAEFPMRNDGVGVTTNESFGEPEMEMTCPSESLLSCCGTGCVV